MDIFPVAPAPQPEPSIQNSTSPGTDDTGFDTVLNKTISSAKETADTSPDSSQNNTPEPDSTNSDAPLAQQTQDSDDAIMPEAQTAGSAPVADQTPGAAQQMPTESRYNSVYVTTVSLNALLEAPQGAGLNQEVKINGETVPSDFKNIHFSFKSLEATINSERSTSNTISQETGAMQENFSGAGKQNSLLLSEIEKLIGQNNDKVAISARFGGNSSQSREMPGYLNSPLLSQIPTNGTAIAVSTPDVSATAPIGPNHLQPDASQPTLRQDAGNHLLNARLAGIETAIDSDSATEKEFQSNTGSGQQASTQQTATTTNSVSVPEHSASNQFFSTLFNSPQTAIQQQSSVSQNLHSLHQPFHVNENEVLSQIVNRFSIQTRLQAGRITLQLHPAELGELKIDVEMKGDSLKANIVAQTQQAQEIIEKNIPRLRAALQEHGMSIDDLLVTFQSDSVEDYSFQQQNHFQDQLNNFQHHTGSAHPLAPEISEEPDEPVFASEQQTAVNLKV